MRQTFKVFCVISAGLVFGAALASASDTLTDPGLNVVAKPEYASYSARLSCKGALADPMTPGPRSQDPGLWPRWEFKVFSNNNLLQGDESTSIVEGILYETTGGKFTTPTSDGYAPSTVDGPRVTAGGRVTFNRTTYTPTRATFADHPWTSDGGVDEGKASVVELTFGAAEPLGRAADWQNQTNVLKAQGARYTLDLKTGEKSDVKTYDVVCVD